MGARVIGVDLMLAIADEYFATPFDEVETPDKHTRRINKIEIE
jgi:ribose 5-phosphate isomerase RpiB